MRILLVSTVCAVAFGAVTEDVDTPKDHLLPYLEKCCLLGQEFARSRLNCDETKLSMAHRQQIPVPYKVGVANITCTISSAFCCEEALEREIHCKQGITAALSLSVCSQQTDLTSKACCNYCAAGRMRRESGSSNCDDLPAEIPMHVREAFSACCRSSEGRSTKLEKKCGKNECSGKTTCMDPIEMCAYDGEGCHYRCVDSAMSCGVGYMLNEFGRCDDIDECALKTHSCGSHEICENQQGSYRCRTCHCDA